MMLLAFVLWLAFAFFFLGSAALWWWDQCNMRTFDQRNALVAGIFARADWLAGLIAYQRVSYRRHMWALMTFRDPLQLYQHEKPKERPCLISTS